MRKGKFRFRHITDIEFNKAQRGWICTVNFRVQTRQQCTMECHFVKGFGGLGLFGFLSALQDALKNTRERCEALQALPGPWNLDGTSNKASA